VAVDDQTIRDFVAANLSNPQAIADAAQANGVTADQIATAMNTSVDSVQNYFVSSGVKPLSYVNKSTGHLMQPTGNVTPEGTPEYLDVTGTAINKAGGGGSSPFNIGNVIKVGLAYALPIVGEAIAAEIGVQAATGTALAAIGTGVAQGQDIGTAIKSAAPALIASNIMSEVDLKKLEVDITKDKNLQNVITNVGNSALKTAIAGGDVKDIVTNAVATGGGTLIGQATGSPTFGQGLATTIATGDIVKGATAAASVAGSQQASANAAQRNIDAERAAIDALLNERASVKYDDGLSLLSQDPNTRQAILPLLAAPGLVSALESAGILLADVAAHTGIIAYLMSLTQSGIQKPPDQIVTEIKLIKDLTNANITPSEANDVIKMVDAKLQPVNEDALKLTKDQVVADLGEITITAKKEAPVNVTTSAVKSGGDSGSPAGGAPSGGVPDTGAPTTPTSPTTPAPATSADKKIIDLINQPTSGGPASATAFTPAPSARTTGGTTNVSGPPQPPAPPVPPTPPTPPGAPGPAQPPGPSQPPGPVTTAPPGPPQPPTPPGLPGDKGTGDKPGAGGDKTSAGEGDGTGTGKTVGATSGDGTTGLGDTGTGTGASTGVGTATGSGKDVATKVDTTEEEPPSITVGTSVVRPKIQAAYPTIVGQFASPLTQAISAYRPAGEIESQATGKEREDVWNVESLRNALGI
jgi:hypothetical protein